MSTITHKFTRPSTEGRVAAVGSLICTPSARVELPAETVLPEAFIQPLEADGSVTLQLDNTNDLWCWCIREDIPRGRTRWVAVTGDADYADLVDVDPSSGVVKPPLPPIWQSYVDGAIAAAPLNGYATLLPWHAAVSRRQSKRVNVGLFGASLVEGAFVESFDRTIGQQLAGLLRAQHGVAGGGRGFIGIPTTAMTTSLEYLPGMWPLALAGPAIDPVDPGPSAFDLGPKHVCAYGNGAWSASLTAGPDASSVVIHHVAGAAGGAAYWRKNGGAKTVFSTFAAETELARAVVPVAPGDVVEFGWEAGGYFILTGVSENGGDEDGGLQVHNLGHAGMTLAQWSDGAAIPASWLEDMASLELDLLIMQDLPINDASTGGGNLLPAAARTAVEDFIALLRVGGITCPIVLAANVDPTGGMPLAAPWQQYVDVLEAIAAADPTITFVNHGERIPSTVGPDVFDLYNDVDHVHAAANGTVNMWYAETYAQLLASR